MATSYIGKPISLLSHSDVRYRGILAGVDQVNSTIQLQNVYSVGTEDRRPPAEFIPPAEQPYQFIIFRASEVKDIALDFDTFEPPPRVRSVHDDPAVIGVQGPPMTSYQQNQFLAQQAQQTVPTSLGTRPPPHQAAAQNGAPTDEQTQAPSEQQTGRSGRRTGGGQRDSSANSGSVRNAAASLEKVERAIGDLRLSSTQTQGQTRSSASNSTNGARTGRRSGGPRQGGGHQAQHVEIKVPTTDFDFESSNARFDKAALNSSHGKTTSPGISDDEKTNPSDEERDNSKSPQPSQSHSQSETKEKDDGAYNPKKSFFDSLSSSATSLPPSGGGRGGRGGRGMGKSRREEEREKNVATFGEPGGVGLMGPGAYVGGYGGYGRRGGRGGRRGGPRRPPVDRA